MKTSVLTALAVAAAALASPALASDPTGLWQTPTNGGQVRIERCGQALCGVLVTSSHIRANPITWSTRRPPAWASTARTVSMKPAKPCCFSPQGEKAVKPQSCPSG